MNPDTPDSFLIKVDSGAHYLACLYHLIEMGFNWDGGISRFVRPYILRNVDSQGYTHIWIRKGSWLRNINCDLDLGPLYTFDLLYPNTPVITINLQDTEP